MMAERETKSSSVAARGTTTFFQISPLGETPLENYQVLQFGFGAGIDFELMAAVAHFLSDVLQRSAFGALFLPTRNRFFLPLGRFGRFAALDLIGAFQVRLQH